MSETVGIDSRQEALSRAFDSALGFLARRVTDPDFSTTVRTAFGEEADRKVIADVLREFLLEGNTPNVKPMAAEALGGARGAYDAKADTIYVSADLIAKNAMSSDAVQRVLLEEMGHAIDSRLNARDSAGDEGAIFADLVLGEPISDFRLQALRAENDHGAIVVDGHMASVEFAANYGSVSLDGSAADWTAADRLEVPGSGTAGFELYGKFTDDAFVFALKSETMAIGADTTFWLNTDQNKATGYQIWGFAGGAEYNVNFDAAGLPKLYTGADGETLVNVTLDHAVAADGKFVEFAVPIAALAGAPTAADVLVDVNNQVFLPNDFSAYTYSVAAPQPPQPPTNAGDITLDGDLSDWTAANRLEVPGSGVAGYTLYGKLVGDSFVFALKADSGEIGAGTTFWLNTDQNTATGYQIWGFAGGSEYNVDFSGRPNLFTGDAGETLVSGDLAHAFNASHNIVEFAVPVSLLAGTPQAVDVLVDVNDQVFLPTDYSTYTYTVAAPQPPPPPPPPATDPSAKVAIVYSDTTAAHYFDITAYSQLFMSAQYQATMAGVPFDVLSEGDLTDVARLANYETIIFPSFSHVSAANVAAIESALKSAVYDYGVGLIAAGDFMTNDAAGAALPGDPYARMKSLLGIDRVGDGVGDVAVHAHDTGHPVMDGYQPNEHIRTYANTGYSHFAGVSGPATVLVDQQIGGQTYNAVLATETGGRNVHFSNTEILADNNLLWQALQWSAGSDGPEIGLQMSRQSSLVAARNDMDQSQETYDVSPDSGPGIYDSLLPLLAEWKAAYNFVGSYYINVGNNPPDQMTDWSISKPYYQQMLAMGNEIGTHSYTHPHDTNALTASQIEFEFNQSQNVIEQQLGIDVVGAAVPGDSENIATSKAIIQYFDYLTGGFSSAGSGYPGAFGYLTPGAADSVYLAPNISFDFTLVGFNHLSPAEAQEAWAKEWAQLTSHADVPIVLWPWHDYGPTEWMIDPPAQSDFTEEMYTNFIASAAAVGSEFVTLADLAQRIKSFEQTKITYTTSGDVVTATVVSNDVGKFALDIDGGQVIKNVDGWYAYDDDSVFMPKYGGQFAISLGATQDDVTHIVALPSRGELLSVTGDGTNLNFSVKGEGKVVVDLKHLAGQSVLVQGAQILSLVDDRLELALANAGQNDVSITMTAGNPPPIIISNGGGDDATVVVAENGLDVATVAASDQDPAALRYGIADSPDADAFAIDAVSGALRFKTAPDFEMPADNGGDNTYEVMVQAIDGLGMLDSQLVSVVVTDVAGIARTGSGARDALTGTAENDILDGAGGADTLQGLAGNDTLLGGSAADTLYGGFGDDRLDGGAGNDLLIGDHGVDRMTGGAGSDRFIFESADEIGTLAAHDVITDFTSRRDRIDLGALDADGSPGASGNQAFQFLAQQGAAFTDAGQLRFVHDTASNATYIEGNLDAGLTADFRIELDGILQLRQTDFVL